MTASTEPGAQPPTTDVAVERAARAWHEAAEEDCGGHFAGPWDAIEPEQRDRARKYVRAALVAADAAVTLRQHVYDGERCRFCGANAYDAALGRVGDCVDHAALVHTSETLSSEPDVRCSRCETGVDAAELDGVAGFLRAATNLAATIGSQPREVVRYVGTLLGSFAPGDGMRPTDDWRILDTDGTERWRASGYGWARDLVRRGETLQQRWARTAASEWRDAQP